MGGEDRQPSEDPGEAARPPAVPDGGIERRAFVDGGVVLAHGVEKTLGVDAAWEDAIDGGRAHSELGVLETRMLPWTVRMLARK